MKIAYEFRLQFTKSQKILEKLTNEIPVFEEVENVVVQTKSTSPPPPPVELIYGESKFDLNEVLVVENENESKTTYQGFLKNLGSEVSATFVNKSRKLRQRVKKTQGTTDLPEEVEPPTVFQEIVIGEDPPLQLHNVIKEQQREKVIVEKVVPYTSFYVRKVPKESKVIIEQINENCEKRQIQTIFECEICQKLFSKQSDFESHRNRGHVKDPKCYVCHLCGHICSTKSSFNHHLVSHRDKIFKCNLCEKVYNTKSHLKEHLKVHENKRLHLCNVCGKNFNWSTSLVYHMRLHTGEKRYVCNYCGLKYRMPNTLKRHLKTHTNERPYICSNCNKGFASYGERKRHELTHKSERVYSCEYCNKSFVRDDYLKTHYLSHPGPHECYICFKTFIEVKFLHMHMRRCHKDDKEDTENSFLQ